MPEQSWEEGSRRTRSGLKKAHFFFSVAEDSCVGVWPASEWGAGHSKDLVASILPSRSGRPGEGGPRQASEQRDLQEENVTEDGCRP